MAPLMADHAVGVGEPGRRSSVKAGLTPKRRRRRAENDEYASFIRRVIRAHAKRVAAGDIDALGDMTTTTYDSVGDITSQTDQLGRLTTYSYDQRGWQISMTEAVGTPVQRTTTTAYDVVGNVLSVIDPRGRVHELSLALPGRANRANAVVALAVPLAAAVLLAAAVRLVAEGALPVVAVPAVAVP